MAKKTLEDQFPKTVFVKEYLEKFGLQKGIMKQIGVVCGELLEVQDTVSRKDYRAAVEELVDVLGATQNILYMIPGYTIKELNEVIEQVKIKNGERGYYGKQKR